MAQSQGDMRGDRSRSPPKPGEVEEQFLDIPELETPFDAANSPDKGAGAAVAAGRRQQQQQPATPPKSLMEQISAQIQKSVLAATSNIQSEVVTGLAPILEQLEERQNRQFDSLAQEITEVRQKRAEDWEEVRDLKDRVKELERIMAISTDPEKNPPATLAKKVAGPRPPDPTVVKLNSVGDISCAAASQAVAKLLEEAGMRLKQTEWRVAGPPLSTRFTVRFAGDPLARTVRAKQLLDSLKLSDTEWKTVHADGPNGPVRCYLGPEKGEAQDKIEAFCKKATKSLQEAYQQVHCNRKDGVVSVNWVPIIRATFVDGEVIAHKHCANIAQQQVSQERLTMAMAAGRRTPAVPVEGWESWG